MIGHLLGMQSLNELRHPSSDYYLVHYNYFRLFRNLP